MDGDGDVDCPYNFDDKTGQNSGSSSSSSTPKPAVTPRPTATPEPEATPWETALDILSALLYCVAWFLPFLALVGILAGVGTLIEIASKKKRQKKAEAEERKRREIYEQEKKQYEPLYSGKQLSDLVQIPDGSSLSSDILPVSDGDGRWGSLYTFYISAQKYHRGNCRYAKKCIAINAYSLAKGDTLQYRAPKKPRTPCSVCKPVLPDIAWVDECRKIDAIKKKYGIT